MPLPPRSCTPYIPLDEQRAMRGHIAPEPLCDEARVACIRNLRRCSCGAQRRRDGTFNRDVSLKGLVSEWTQRLRRLFARISLVASSTIAMWRAPLNDSPSQKTSLPSVSRGRNKSLLNLGVPLILRICVVSVTYARRKLK
ncbi:hypothetical protein BDW22DRAFT_550745 [Trametopsis cervina]|nr:hypothetical protein BDW22DRAFT_550745 [Trametopsis cervina]